MIFWLLLVLLLPHCDLCRQLKRKCPLKQMMDRRTPLNYYRPGDYVISGITSTTNTVFSPFVFVQPPYTQFLSPNFHTTSGPVGKNHPVHDMEVSYQIPVLVQGSAIHGIIMQLEVSQERKDFEAQNIDNSKSNNKNKNNKNRQDENDIVERLGDELPPQKKTGFHLLEKE
ncbi:hypothetical protein JD844_013522 [Phrynosoma platyrhinos]|uniref:Uncharacterized protein n=1 Tax=Phrynosoma platyrhinos TaxID=52577 RepID=A0ABQ7TMT9_PHRPL|nr:hypothetical protein JD844_013522 [Phrynosoma platyrhinos]